MKGTAQYSERLCIPFFSYVQTGNDRYDSCMSRCSESDMSRGGFSQKQITLIHVHEAWKDKIVDREGNTCEANGQDPGFEMGDASNGMQMLT